MAEESLEHVFEIADDDKRLRDLIAENPVAYATWRMGRAMGWDNQRTNRAIVAALCLWGKIIVEQSLEQKRQAALITVIPEREGMQFSGSEAEWDRAVDQANKSN